MKKDKVANGNYIVGRVNVAFLIGLSMYLMFLFYLTFLSPSYGRGEFHRAYEIIPLKNVIISIINNNISAIKVNILGNIAAFVPMGFLVPFTFSNLQSIKKILMISLAATLFIEMMQFILAVGVTEIDDVILNVLGAVIGFVLWKAQKSIRAVFQTM